MSFAIKAHTRSPGHGMLCFWGSATCSMQWLRFAILPLPLKKKEGNSLKYYLAAVIFFACLDLKT